MPRTPPDAGPVPPNTPPPAGDEIVDLNDAAAWSIDYYNRRAGAQLAALYALQVAAGGLIGG